MRYLRSDNLGFKYAVNRRAAHLACYEACPPVAKRGRSSQLSRPSSLSGEVRADFSKPSPVLFVPSWTVIRQRRHDVGVQGNTVLQFGTQVDNPLDIRFRQPIPFLGDVAMAEQQMHLAFEIAPARCVDRVDETIGRLGNADLTPILLQFAHAQPHIETRGPADLVKTGIGGVDKVDDMIAPVVL